MLIKQATTGECEVLFRRRVSRFAPKEDFSRFRRYRDRNRFLAVITAGTSYVNSNGTSQSSGSVTMTTVDAHSLVLVAIAIDDDGTAATITAPTTVGNVLTFVQIGSTLRSVNNFSLAIFRAYSASALGSTAISSTWTQSNDWVMGATDYLGTAGTSANNGSDAIGNINSAVGTSAATSLSTTVASSSNNNSKYYGAYVVANTSDGLIVKGASYTANVPDTYNGNFVTLLTELSTNPVTPAASTAVNGTNSAAAGVPTPGIFGVELLVFSFVPVTPPTLYNVGRLPGMPPQVSRG